jgi:hypothetical protein
MIALICFVLAVLASPFKSKSRLEALGGFTIITSPFEFSVHTHEGIWLSRAILQVSHNRRFAPQYFATRQTVRQKVLLPLWVLCHEHRLSTRRGATVLEMKEGPSGSAIRSLIPSHRERLWSKATVVSVAETSGR